MNHVARRNNGLLSPALSSSPERVGTGIGEGEDGTIDSSSPRARFRVRWIFLPVPLEEAEPEGGEGTSARRVGISLGCSK